MGIKIDHMIAVWCSHTSNHGWGGGSHAVTECAEHIHTIITSAQEADNLIADQLRLLVES